MQILLAHDGSPGADQALELLNTLNLPPNTAITVARVLPSRAMLFEPAGEPDGSSAADEGMLGEIDAALKAAAQRLAAPGRRVDSRVLRGRPADAILAEASLLESDLIVMGSRGHGPFKTALLGSVSTEVVTASPRPVLVARGTNMRRAVFATDGTDTSALALDVVAGWPIFADVEITVISVSEPFLAMTATDPTATTPYLLELEAEIADQRRAAHAEMARAAAEKLRESGRSATEEVRVGNPAHQIVEVAEAHAADLIVTGSRRSSVRFPGVIGSVARNVLQHAKASVLVVREPMTAVADEAALADLVAAQAGTEERR